MPQATAAAEPLDEPPGVRAASNGLRVGPERPIANSVVTVFPTMTAPAWRSAITHAASNFGTPILVDGRVHLRRHVGRCDDVFDGDGTAIDGRKGTRALVAACRRVRGFSRAAEVDCHERPNRPVLPRDRLEALFEQSAWRRAAVAETSDGTHERHGFRQAARHRDAGRRTPACAPTPSLQPSHPSSTRSCG